MKALGLDVSTSKTGVVLLEETGTSTPKLLLEKIVAFPKLTGFERYRAIALEIMELVHSRLQPEDRIVIEGYSLNLKNASSVVPLVEVGSLVRFMFHIDGKSWLDPRATELKQFATGKGNSPKEMVVAHVLSRWGHLALDNNTADAYALSCMGLAHANRLPGVTQSMRLIVGGLAIRT
jgi:crossover junction endodeoxyribonuclease RuvC